MTPHDEQRFAKLISDFAEGSGFEKPFHLIVLDARGSACVSRYGPHGGVDVICSGPAKANKLKMIPPLVATVISQDGTGKAAVIEVVKGQPTLQ